MKAPFPNNLKGGFESSLANLTQARVTLQRVKSTSQLVVKSWQSQLSMRELA